jgi:hypothetical protein
MPCNACTDPNRCDRAGLCQAFANQQLPALPTPTEEQQEERGRAVYLSEEEISFVLNELHSAGHGHGSSNNDFEPECPSCTAADKLKTALSAGVEGRKP